MITARSSFGAPRIRRLRNPAAAFWPALLFFAFLYAHGVYAHSVYGHGGSSAGTAHHFSPASAAAASPFLAAPSVRAAVAAPGEDGTPHPAEHCMPGRPDLDAVTADCPRAEGRRGTGCPSLGGAPAPRGAPQAHGAPDRPAPGVLRI